MRMRSLSPEEQLFSLPRQLVYRPVIGSTNDLARTLASQGAPEGTVVLANEQTAGRGRQGRRWLAPPRSSLLMSLIFRPSLPPSLASHVLMACALGVVEGIEGWLPGRVGLKWPNDILVDHRKAGGLLAESGIQGDALEFVVVGIGVNINFTPACVPGIPPDATSLSEALGRDVDRVSLLSAILAAIDHRYAQLRQGEPIHEAWRQRLETLGKWVEVSTPRGSVQGWAEDTTSEGALSLRLPDGRRIAVTAGEATLRPARDENQTPSPG